MLFDKVVEAQTPRTWGDQSSEEGSSSWNMSRSRSGISFLFTPKTQLTVALIFLRKKKRSFTLCDNKDENKETHQGDIKHSLEKN